MSRLITSMQMYRTNIYIVQIFVGGGAYPQLCSHAVWMRGINVAQEPAASMSGSQTTR